MPVSTPVSNYILLGKSNLPKQLSDGEAYPLLKWDGIFPGKHQWAVAVSKGSAEGLLGKVLIKLGFQRSANHKELVFFHLDKGGPIHGDGKFYAGTYLDGLNKGQLQEHDSTATTKVWKSNQLKIKNVNPNLGLELPGGDIIPRCTYGPKGASYIRFAEKKAAPEVKPEFRLSFSFDDNLECRGQRIGFVPGSEHQFSIVQKPPVDDRCKIEFQHVTQPGGDWTQTSVKSGLCGLELMDRELVFSLYLGAEFPLKTDVPVTVTVAQKNIRCRFPSRKAMDVLFHEPKAGNCVSVTVSSPLVQASVSGSDSLRLLEPFQREIDKSLEHLEQVLTYTLRFCFGSMGPSNQDPVVLFSTTELNNGFEWKKFWTVHTDITASVVGVGKPDFSIKPEVSGLDPKKGLIELKEGRGALSPKGLKPTLRLKRMGGRVQSWHIENIEGKKITVKPPKDSGLNLPSDSKTLTIEIPVFQPTDVSKDGLTIDFSPWIHKDELPGDSTSLKINLLDKEYKVIQVRRVKPLGLDGEYLKTIKIEPLPKESLELASTLPDKKDFIFEFCTDITQPLMKSHLSELLGDHPGADFRFCPPSVDSKNLPIKLEPNKFPDLPIPVELRVKIPRLGSKEASFNSISLALWLQYGLEKFDLKSNRIFFYLPELATNCPEQLVDLDVLTLSFPSKPTPTVLPWGDSHDGYLDLESRELVIDLKRDSEPNKPKDDPKLKLYFPGGLKSSSDEEKSNRFLMELGKIDPEAWPEKGDDKKHVALRISPKGITFDAKVSKSNVEIEKGGGDTALQKTIEVAPQDKFGDLESRIVVIDNRIRAASVFAKMKVPGCDNLLADMEVGLRQVVAGKPPVVTAQMQLEKSNKTPVTGFSIGFLQLQIDAIRFGIEWRKTNGSAKWDFDAEADGQVSFMQSSNVVKDLEGLKNPAAIKVRGLSLKKLNFKSLTLPLPLDEPVRFNILDGLFSAELGDMDLTWELDKRGVPRPRLFGIEHLQFGFKPKGALEVKLSAGKLRIRFDNDFKAHIELPSTIGIEAKLGPTVHFTGECGWVEATSERYFFAAGSVEIKGFPRVTALLKIGVGRKASGNWAPSVVIYGAMDMDVPLFSGVVVKNLGGGIGINNRLLAIGSDPTPDEIISKINMLEPHKVNNWGFVTEHGVYISIVAAVTLASHQGGDEVLNAYVARLIATLDSEFRHIVAAGKIWISASTKFVREHADNPVLVGALVLSPSQLKLSAVLESQPNPAIENNALLQKIFSQGRIRFSFRLTPELVDYYLEEVSYRDDLFGIQMLYSGSYRVAIFRGAVLLRSDLQISGDYVNSLSADFGGFTFSGHVWLRAGFGGLISGNGIMAYAYIDAGVTFDVAAWIEIRFSITIKLFKKKWTKTWTVKFSQSIPKLELRIRGQIAIAEDGRIGFDGTVGISVSICGYRLSIEPRLSFQPEIYDEVRGQVAAFENQLIKAIGGRQRVSLTDVPSETMLDDASLDKSREPTEQWLLYTRQKADGKYLNLLIPSGESDWFTPTHSSITKITQSGTLIRITSPKHGLKGTDQVVISGVRGNAAINKTWRIERVVDANDFDLADSAAVEATGEGGAWYCNDGKEDHFPPFADDVELLVAYGKQQVIEPIGGNTVRLPGHGFQEGRIRCVLVRGPNGSKIAGLWLAQSKSKDEIDLLGKPLKEVNIASANHTLARATMVYTPWNRVNWDAQPWKPTVAGVADLVEKCRHIQTLFFETSSPSPSEGKSIKKIPSLAEYKVLMDPRVESASPQYWKLEDQLLLPSYALPYEFRDIEELMSEGPVDVKELEDMKEFEKARERALRVKYHRSHDLDEAAELHQKRASLTKLLWDDFSCPAGPEQFGVLAHHPNCEDVVLGTIFEFGEQLTTGSNIFMLRTDNAQPESVTPKVPSEKYEFKPLPVRQKFQLLEDGAQNGGKERAKVLVKLPIRLNEKTLLSDLTSLNYFQIYRRIGQEQPVLIADQVRPDLTFLDDPGRDDEGRTAKNKLIVNPFLFTDEFDVENRKFVKEGLRAGRTEIAYQIRHVPHHEKASTGTAGLPWDLQPFGAVQLHIPERDEFPKDLGILLPVSSLIHEIGSGEKKSLPGERFGEFCLVSCSGEKLEVAAMGEKPLDVNDFELWCEEFMIQQTGFYGGEDERPIVEQRGDSSTTTLQDVPPGQRHQSAEGKHRVPVIRAATGAGEAQVQSFWISQEGKGLFRTGFGYRFFVRPSKDARVKLLAPLPVFLVREMPMTWTAAVKAKSVECVEFLESKEVQRIWAEEAVTCDSFSVDDDYRQGRNALQVKFESGGTMDGGAEIVFQDRDDSSYAVRQMCELKERTVFQSDRLSFADPALWTLRRDMDTDRIPARWNLTMPNPSDDDRNKYFVDSTRPSEVLIRLNSRLKALDSISPSNWEVFEKTLTDWLQAEYLFRRSPLNTNDPTTKTLIGAIHLTIRCMLIGMGTSTNVPPPPGGPITPGTLETVLKSAVKVIEELKKNEAKIRDFMAKGLSNPSSPADTGAAETGPDMAEDYGFLRHLTGILVRRFAIANDIAGLKDADLPGTAPNVRFAAGPEPLPGECKWKSIAGEHKASVESGARLPLATELLSQVSGENVDRARKNLSALARTLVLHAEDPRERARVVPRAAGLTLVLDEIERHVQGELDVRLIKRPHHELTTSIDKSGTTLPNQTSIEDFLPDAARRHEKDQPPQPPHTGFIRLGERVSRLVTAGADGRVRLWAGEAAGSKPSKLREWQFLKHDSGTVTSVDVIQYGSYQLAVACAGSGPAIIWDILRGAKILQIPGQFTHAIFTTMQEGLGVLTASGDKPVTLWMPNLAEGKLFKKSTKEYRYSVDEKKPLPDSVKSLAMHSEKGFIAAGLHNGKVMVWQRATLVSIQVLESGINSEVKAVAFAFTPDGLKLLAGIGEKLYAWPISPTGVFGEEEIFSTNSVTITGIAVEPQTAWVAVATSGTDALLWRPFAKLTDTPEPLPHAGKTVKAVSFIRESDEPHIITACLDGTVTDWGPSKTGTMIQEHVVNHGTGLEVMASARMDTVASDLSRSVVSYFNLLERMGFAVDIAMVGENHMLLEHDGLVDKLRKTIQSIAGQVLDRHYVFVGAGQEIHANYDPRNPVGYSFVKLAVVPKEFHDLCLWEGCEETGTAEELESATPNKIKLSQHANTSTGHYNGQFIALIDGQGRGQVRKITAYSGTTRIATVEEPWTIGERPDSPPRYYILSQDLVNWDERLRKWFDLRRLNVGPPLSEDATALIYLLHLREMARYLGRPKVLNSGTARVVDKRNVQLRFFRQATAGAYTDLPIDLTDSDNKITRLVCLKHRSDGIVKAHRPFDLPELRECEWSVTDRFVVIYLVPRSERWLTTPCVGGRSHSTWTVPERKGHRFRVAVRRVSRYEPLIRWAAGMNGPVPIPRHAGVELGKGKTAIPVHHWADASVLPIPDPHRNEGSRALTVYTYPHPAKIHFSYQLPPDGARSIYNQISAIRTGFKGCELGFRYDLIQGPSGPEKEFLLSDLLKEVNVTTTANPVQLPESKIKTVPVNDSMVIRLFRHERLQSLSDLPFYYRYRMDVRSLYRSRTVDAATLGEADVLSQDPGKSPYGERQPSRFGLFQPSIKIKKTSRALDAGLAKPNRNELAIEDSAATQDVRKYLTNQKAGQLGVLVTATMGSEKERRVVLEYNVQTRTLLVDREWPDGFKPDKPYLFQDATYELIIYFSRNIDHLTLTEDAAEPKPLVYDLGKEVVAKAQAKYLPDFFTDYGIYYWNKSDPVATPAPGDRLYLPVGWVRSPWSQEIPPLSSDPPKRTKPEKSCPRVKLDAEPLSLTRAKGRSPLPVPVQLLTSNSKDVWLYWVTFEMKLKWGAMLYSEPSQYFLQAMRKGVRSKVIQFKELPS
jgi:hypothetical protein